MDRLPIGTILQRRGSLDQHSREATQALREHLEDLHAALKQGRLDEARQHVARGQVRPRTLPRLVPRNREPVEPGNREYNPGTIVGWSRHEARGSL